MIQHVLILSVLPSTFFSPNFPGRVLVDWFKTSLDLERDKTKDEGMMLYSAFYKENLLIFRIGVKVDKIVTHVDFFLTLYMSMLEKNIV